MVLMPLLKTRCTFTKQRSHQKKILRSRYLGCVPFAGEVDGVDLTLLGLSFTMDNSNNSFGLRNTNFKYINGEIGES